MARSTISKGVLVVVMVLAGVSARGDEPQLAVGTAPGQQTRGAKLGAPEMNLSLQDAVAVALSHNINLEVARLGLASSAQGVLGATGIFDPYLQGKVTTAASDSPSTTELSGATVLTGKQAQLNLSLAQLLPTGANVAVGWTNTRTESNSTYVFLNPSYSSGLTFSLTQPLLKGWGTDVNRYTIEVARRSRDITRIGFEQTVISTVQQVESAYWNLVYQRDDLKVKQQSLKLAQDLLDQTKTRVRIGTSAPIDIVQSEATVAAREQDIIVAENAVANAVDQVKLLLGFENTDDWKSNIVPSDSLEIDPSTVDLDEATGKALATRLELKQRALERESKQIGVVAASSATRPELDLNAGYGYSGVGGTATLTTGDTVYTVRGGWNDALRQIRNRDFKEWSAGLSLTYPLGNNQAKAQLAQSRFALATADQNFASERQAVIADVRAAVRGLEAGAKSIAAAIKARELAERNLDAEQKKFANGMSTNYQVLKIQEDLAIAEAAELQSRVFYRQARVAYEVAIGNLLTSKGVSLKEEGALREPHTFLKDVSWLKYDRSGKIARTSTNQAPPAPPAAKE